MASRKALALVDQEQKLPEPESPKMTVSEFGDSEFETVLPAAAWKIECMNSENKDSQDESNFLENQWSISELNAASTDMIGSLVEICIDIWINVLFDNAVS